MKRFSFKRALALFLGLLMMLSALTAILTFTVSAAPKKEHTIQNGTGKREPIRVGQTYSYRAKVQHTFTAFGINMPTWEKTDSVCTLHLYKWQGTFEATVAGTPIASKTFDPMRDGARNWVEFDAQPAGEYLFHITDARGKFYIKLA